MVREKGTDCPAYGYILGVICHYVLDSKCHPYINKCEADSGVTHMEIEEELDKHFMRKDGVDPFSYPVKQLVPADKVTAEAAEPFYARKLAEVHKSLKWMKFIKGLFTAPGKLKYHGLHWIMKLAGQYDKWHCLINQRKDNPVCALWNLHISRLFGDALPEATEAMRSFEASVKGGFALNDRFNRTFG